VEQATALGEVDLLTNLQLVIPACALDGGQDNLGADVAFSEASFVQDVPAVPCSQKVHKVRKLTGFHGM
jgi:hypothetical protein